MHYDLRRADRPPGRTARQCSWSTAINGGAGNLALVELAVGNHGIPNIGGARGARSVLPPDCDQGLSWPSTRFGAQDDRKRVFGSKILFLRSPCDQPQRCLDSSLKRRGVDSRDERGHDNKDSGRVGRAQPSANAIRAANLLDKIRNSRYAFTLSEFISRSPLDGRENEKTWLFETLAHNPPGEPGRGSDFLNYIAHNPLKRLDFGKINVSKR